MLRAERRSNNYQCYSLGFDSNEARTHDLSTNQGEHVHHYTTDAVFLDRVMILLVFFIIVSNFELCCDNQIYLGERGTRRDGKSWMMKELVSRIKEIDVGSRARNYIIFILWLKVHDLSYLTTKVPFWIENKIPLKTTYSWYRVELLLQYYK